MYFILLNGSDGIESACSAGDPDLIPGSGRFPWRREWLPTPVLLPGEFMDRGAWWATVHGLQRVGHDLATKEQQQQQRNIA